MKGFTSIIAFTLTAFVSAAPTINRHSSSSVPTYDHCVQPGHFALTFDDGPFQYSWDLAKYLHSRGIKATFFTNGNNWVENFDTATTSTSDGTKSYIDVLKYYHELGHEIGSHTYEHKVLKGLTTAEVEYQMNQQSDLIYKAIGQRPRLMRPPEGELDNSASTVLNGLGYSNILWDIDTKDYELKGLAHEQELVRGVVDTDSNGHISLQHDVHESSAVELTPWMIDYITSKGYTFVTISECLGISAYQ
ncbi:hypothetical protein [Parasitella parasitica]|uniref:NodB homology domain-containing protein n=1 Tax=Parasitella parasitica TaxID=35722 RepID=A0A0B7NFN4_9FUNG|nr:hypothetical protein [Parasitella parasitica]